MSKTYEVILGYRIFVTGESIEQVKKAGRALAKQTKVFPAKDITVKEAQPDKSDGRWIVEDGIINRVPLEVNTLEDLAAVQTFDGDIASVAQTGSAYTLVAEVPKGFDKRAFVPSKHAGAWLDIGALQAYMRGAQEAAG